MFDFEGMLNALRDDSAMENFQTRKELLCKYKNEIAILLVTFRGAKIIGRNEIPPEPAVNCDLCGNELLQNGLYVDGQVDDEAAAWANMCSDCFVAKGAAVGWGVGQLYMHNGAYWHCIGGGNPDACNEHDET